MAPQAEQQHQHPIPASDRSLVAQLSQWFDTSRRVVPWRPSTARVPHEPQTRDPYTALVSEAMLQQTQASRVVERLPLFLSRFPDIHALASADEHDVLAAWSGLGYYRRAKHLHAAAREVVSRFGGTVPPTTAELGTLPGVGRYTAGAIASIVFNRPSPIVDANVSRVLLRLHGSDAAPDASGTVAWVWSRAEDLVRAAAASQGDQDGSPAPPDPSACNEGLMELGALVCTPRSPSCGSCPWQRPCRARACGAQSQIPAAKSRATSRKTVQHAAVIVRDAQGRVLLERRPDKGLWAGMWQAPTLEHEGARSPSKIALARFLQDRFSLPERPQVERADRFEHQTTHRLVVFTVWAWPPSKSLVPPEGSEFVTSKSAQSLALATPHRRILTAAFPGPQSAGNPPKGRQFGP